MNQEKKIETLTFSRIMERGSKEKS